MLKARLWQLEEKFSEATVPNKTEKYTCDNSLGGQLCKELVLKVDMANA